MKTVLALNHDALGHGDHALGQKVLGTFLRKAIAFKNLHAILMYNGGVKLAAEGSPVMTELRQLHENGVDIMPCGTCVDHYGLREKIAVGRISNMDELIGEMDKAAKVITL